MAPSVTAAPATTGHPSPRDIFRDLYTRHTPERFAVALRWGPPGYFRFGLLALVGHLAAYIAAVAVTCPLCYAVLPVTRRKARVRWRHIARITAYSLAILPAFLLLGIVINLLSRVFHVVRYDLFEHGYVLSAYFGAPAFLALWWWTANRRYLRLPHAAGVALIMTILAVLLVLGTGFYRTIAGLLV